jgi:DNA polymerase III beta subunit-like protein
MLKYEPTTYATVSVTDFKRAVKFAVAFLKGKRPFQHPGFSIQVKDGELHLKAVHDETEPTLNSIPADVVGETCSHEVWLNPQYVLDALKPIKSKTCGIGLGTPMGLVNISGNGSTPRLAAGRK